MTSRTNRGVPGDEFVAPLSIPAGSKIPDPATEFSNPDEYDRYFRILRKDSGLLEWSRACVQLYKVQQTSLDQTSLTADEKLQILRGMLLVQQITLERWVKTGDAILRDK